MQKITAFFLMLLIGIWFLPLQASELKEADQRIRAILAQRLPNLELDAIAETGLDNLYEVTFGTRVIYVDGDGRYLVNGDVMDLKTGQSITEQRERDLKASALAQVDEKGMIIYGDKNAEHTISVFTDIDCGYCRKLHSEIDQYIAEGIRVRYLAFPRAGVASDAAKKAESVWCSDDPNAAMTLAKKGEKVESKACENPVAAHYELGQQFGIRGTPAIILNNGEVLPGYVPAKRLKQALSQRVAAAK